MAEVIARDADRLPWLADEKVLPKAAASWWRLPLLVTALVAAAMAIVWLGVASQFANETPPAATQPEVTTALPEAAPEQALAQQPAIAPIPEVKPVPVPAPPVLRMQEDVRPARDAAPAKRVVARGASAPAAEAQKATPKIRQYSNPWESAGASGRMVRVGTYTSLRQGKVAWSRLARTYPGMKKLPAVVTDIPSLRNGKVYYRLQIGTTSQAHSEVLCQRMRSIGQSCVVVDVAGARKGSGDDGQPAVV